MNLAAISMPASSRAPVMPGERRRDLGLALLGSLVFHGAAIVAVSSPPGQVDGRVIGAPFAARLVMVDSISLLAEHPGGDPTGPASQDAYPPSGVSAERGTWVRPPAQRLTPPSEPPALLKPAPPMAKPDPDPLPPLERLVSASALEAPAPASVPASAAAMMASMAEYRPGSALDERPRPIGDIEPDYPEQAAGQEGVVVLRLLINALGKVDDVIVVRAAPEHLFDAAARDAFAKADFLPGRLGGVPVRSQMTVEVRFTPLNRGAEVVGRGY